ncbi:MAG: preprotein translocase subunit SecA [Candidatus Moranbacteria bacterium]|nr:preprotein translocase subunit SecA [Candidatus Moranbacteria bacterium]
MSILTKITKIFGDPNEKELKKLSSIVDQTNAFEPEIEKLSNQELKDKKDEFRQRLKKGETLEDILAQAFAVCREASKRVLEQRPFDTQLLGAIALHQGKIAEMKTGEGKTLASALAIYLNALEGKGVHLITVNDYLARRDTNWMGALYHFLGLTIGCIQSGGAAYIFDPRVKSDGDEVSIEYENLKPANKKQAYEADITYGTNNEFGFDYLRDNMVLDINEMSQLRDKESLIEFEKRIEQEKKSDKVKPDEKKLFKKDYLNFAIVDEVDSILIDESRTPLIISAPDVESAKLYQRFSKIVPSLEAGKDFNIDEKMQAITITDRGIERVQKMLGIENLYDNNHTRHVHHLHQALKAQFIFKKDKQYMVKDGEVLIVDEFTGRVMPGRRFSEGLHQALEAKEGVKVQRESKTLATITFQNFFRLYKKLAGMTGTAMTSAEEFSKVYDLDILAVPTHKTMIRDDMADKIYKSEHGKLLAITQDIKEKNKKGQPLLIGTVSVEKSELLSKYLDKAGLEYEILNAKNHEREAQIIANAGQKKSITVATNMAGRGTDIKLGKGVKKLGGLRVIGTERHEARRIDNQLRGRSGRQGDPGSSQFYISLEDEIMRRFGSDKIKGIMDTFKLPEDHPIESKMVSNQIEKAQKKIEGFNFDIRKHVLEYDDVINRQRESIYQRRRRILLGLTDRAQIEQMIKALTGNFVKFHTQEQDSSVWNIKEIYEYCFSLFGARKDFYEKLKKVIKREDLERARKRKKIIKKVKNFAVKAYQNKEKEVGEKALRHLERVVMLRTIDQLWMEHIDNMQFLREGVGLRGYGQRDPLIEYKKEGYEMFQDLLDNIRLTTVETLFKARIQVKSDANNSAEKDQETSEVEDAQVVSSSGSASGLLKNATESRGGQTGESQAPIVQKKVGRNEPCPCGSGKKFKKCCGKKA